MDEADEEADSEPQFQSSPASSQSTQHDFGKQSSPEKELLLHYDITRRDLRIIRRFLEYNGYNQDQKKVAIMVGWTIGDEGLRLVKTWISEHGDEVYD